MKNLLIFLLSMFPLFLLGQTPSEEIVIHGPDSVCKNADSVYYYIDIVPGASEYVWDNPGCLATREQNQNHCIFIFNNAGPGSCQIYVYAYDSLWQLIGSASKVIEVLPPYHIDTIFGDKSACQNDKKTYFISPKPGLDSCKWDLPVAWEIVDHSEKYDTIHLFFGSALSGALSVTGYDSCGAGNTTSIAITVDPTYPHLMQLNMDPADHKICKNDLATFTISPTSSFDSSWLVNYQWYLNSIPVGTNDSTYQNALLNHGDSVKCIVTILNYSCANITQAPAINVLVDSIDPGAVISLDSAFCQYNPACLAVSDKYGKIQQWEYQEIHSSDWTIISQKTDTLCIDNGIAGTFRYRAKVESYSGKCTPQYTGSKAIMVKPGPSPGKLIPKDSVDYYRNSKLLLLCTSCNNDTINFEYQWGVIMPDGISFDTLFLTEFQKKYFYLFEGNNWNIGYKYILVIKGKGNNFSGCITPSVYSLTPISIAKADYPVKVFPNPVNGYTCTILLSGPATGNIHLTVFDYMGRKFKSTTINKTMPHQAVEIDLTGLPEGISIFRFIEPDGNTYTERVVVY